MGDAPQIRRFGVGRNPQEAEQILLSFGLLPLIAGLYVGLKKFHDVFG